MTAYYIIKNNLPSLVKKVNPNKYSIKNMSGTRSLQNLDTKNILNLHNKSFLSFT